MAFPGVAIKEGVLKKRTSRQTSEEHNTRAKPCVKTPANKPGDAAACGSEQRKAKQTSASASTEEGVDGAI